MSARTERRKLTPREYLRVARARDSRLDLAGRPHALRRRWGVRRRVSANASANLAFAFSAPQEGAGARLYRAIQPRRPPRNRRTLGCGQGGAAGVHQAATLSTR